MTVKRSKELVDKLTRSGKFIACGVKNRQSFVMDAVGNPLAVLHFSPLEELVSIYPQPKTNVYELQDFIRACGHTTLIDFTI